VLDLIGGGFFSLGEADRFKPIIDSLRGHDPYLVSPTSTPTSTPRRAPPPPTATRATGLAAPCTTSSAARASERSDHPALRGRDLAHPSREDDLASIGDS